MKDCRTASLFDATLFGVLLFLGFMVCVYAPLDTYIANPDDIAVLFSLFWWMTLVIQFSFSLVGYLIGILIPVRYRNIYKTVIFWGGVCTWLQYHFLSLDVGVMDGHQIDWSLFRRQMILNVLLWIAVLVIMLVICVYKPFIQDRLERLISIGFTSMLLISLSTSMIQNRDTLFVSNDEIEYLSDRGEFEISQEGQNIIVFILDMYDETYFREIMDSGYDLSLYDGFTYYDNHAGSYSTTQYSIPFLLTGEQFLNQEPFSDWLDSFDDKEMYSDILTDADWDMYYYMESISSFVPQKCYRSAANLESAKPGIVHKKHFMYELYRLVGCRCLPDIVKPYIWMDGTEFKGVQGFDSEYQASSDDNLGFYSRIDGAGEVAESSGARNSLKYIYLYGTHHPYTMNEDLETIDHAYDDEAAISCAKGLIRIIGIYLEQLKALDCYDNTAIIITADHGFYLEGVRSAPVLLIKPMNSRGVMSISNAPVAQSDLGATILELAGVSDSPQYGESALDVHEGEDRERYFYQYYLADNAVDGNRRLIEFSIPSSDNLYSDYRLTGIEYMTDGTQINHSSYCKTCQDAEAESDLYTPFQVYHEPTGSYPSSSIIRP